MNCASVSYSLCVSESTVWLNTDPCGELCFCVILSLCLREYGLIKHRPVRWTVLLCLREYGLIKHRAVRWTVLLGLFRRSQHIQLRQIPQSLPKKASLFICWITIYCNIQQSFNTMAFIYLLLLIFIHGLIFIYSCVTCLFFFFYLNT